MKKERGLSLVRLLVGGFLLALLAIAAMKVVPSVIEYYKIEKAVRTVAGQATGSTTVGEVRNAYAKFVDIDVIKAVQPEDLEVYKDSGQIVISFSYSQKIKIAGPVSLVIDYEGASTGSGRGE